jgi:glycosyltransferase involved in cell wall biosynthesis
MRTEVIALKNASTVEKVYVITDQRYRTEVDKVKYYYLSNFIAKIPVFRVFARIPIMLRICRKEKINLLICFHLTSYGLAGYIVSRLLGKPLSVHFLGKDLDKTCNLPVIGNSIIRFANKIDILTVQGTNSKEFLTQKKINRVHIIPTACDIKKFSASNKPKKFDIIFVGRISKEKRIDRFIEIVKILNYKNYPIKALIVGSGPYQKKMLNLIKTYKLNHLVNFIGWKDDVVRYLSRTKIFVLTSDNDQLPSSLLEAMAMGLVPVVTKVGNLSDVVDDKNIIELNAKCSERFANRITELLNDEVLFEEQSKIALKRVQKFSIEANSVRWNTVVEDLKKREK